VDGNVDARLALESIERVTDLFDRLIRAIEGRAENGDDSDRVLIAELDRFLRRQMEAVAIHRHEAHLDVPVVCEFLPTHLDVDPHAQVGGVGRLALGGATLLPAPLEGQSA
jgi:hypothetical protein